MANPITLTFTFVPLGNLLAGQKFGMLHVSQIGATISALLVSDVVPSACLYCPTATYVSVGGLPTRSLTPCFVGPTISPVSTE